MQQRIAIIVCLIDCTPWGTEIQYLKLEMGQNNLQRCINVLVTNWLQTQESQTGRKDELHSTATFYDKAELANVCQT